MTTLLAALIVFGVLITVHELGHFAAAKLVGMQVDEFAIGFGPKLYQTEKKGTVYTLRALPLGGFNRIAGMEPGEENVENGFHTKPLWARMVVILAGVTMNFLLPLLLFFGIFFFHGTETPVNEPVLGRVMDHQPASDAGLMKGDRIISINGTKLSAWTDVSTLIQEAGSKKSTLVIQRGGKTLEKTLIPQFDQEAGRYLIGVMPTLEKRPLGLSESVRYAVLTEGRIMKGMVDGLRQILTGKAGVNVAGPIGVAQMAGSVAQEGMIPFLTFIAFLSLNLGILNLIPIPALDGGQFLILAVEGILRHPLPPKAKERVQLVGVALILGLTIYATISDILR